MTCAQCENPNLKGVHTCGQSPFSEMAELRATAARMDWLEGEFGNCSFGYARGEDGVLLRWMGRSYRGETLAEAIDAARGAR